MTAPHRAGCDCLIHRNNAHPDGCIPSYGPSADCPTHPPTADDRVAVWLGQIVPSATPYQKACERLAELRCIADNLAEGFTTPEQVGADRMAALVAAGYWPEAVKS